MKTRIWIIFRTSFVLVFLIGFVSCDRDRNHPGWDFFPDMFYSKALETGAENPVFKDGQSMRTPVEGTIPREMVPYPFPKTDEGMAKAGMELKNPFNLNEENLHGGKNAYRIYCSICHGDLGDGKGFLHTSGKYIYPPATLVSPKMKNKPDGEIFHSITVGYGIMGAHASQISPEDRWNIVLYIREILQADSSE